MFKKIEIWILYLVVLLGIPLTISFGVLVRHEILGGTRFGRVSKTALFLAEIPLNIKKALNYDLQVEDRFPLINGFDGTPNSSESYLLLSRFDGDSKEGIVELVDLMKELDLIKGDKKMAKRMKTISEKNLDIIATAAKLRKDYEESYRQLREIVYPKSKGLRKK